MGDAKFTVIGTEVAHRGAVVTTEILQVRAPDGQVVERQVVRHPGAVAVVAVHEGSVVLLRQYRAALDHDLVEIPAGKCDVAGEDPVEAAKRELVEEVGLDARELHLLGSFVTAAGFSDEVIIIYAAIDCVEVGRAVEGVEEEYSEVIRVPVDEILPWMCDGRLTDAKSLIGLFWAREAGLLDTPAR